MKCSGVYRFAEVIITDIKVLKNFMKIAESGSICKAARELHLSQPPLSKQMQNLEEELGVRLFERSVKGVELTEEGQRLYSHAEALIAHNDLILRELSSGTGIIRFGTTTSSIEYSLALIREFNKDNIINFEITEGNTFKLLDFLDNNIIDLAFVRTPYKLDLKFSHIKLTDDNLIVAGSSEYFDTDAEKISIYEMSKKPLIVIRRWKEHLDMVASKKGLSLDYKYVCDDNRTALSIARNRMGVAILPSSITKHYPYGHPLVEKVIKDSSFDTSIFLVYQPSKNYNKPTTEFLDFILSNSFSV